MTEYEILSLYDESMDSLWTLMQFWSSVSFGYMALGMIAVKRLNLVSIIVFSVLYIAFSMQMAEAVEIVHMEIASHLESMKFLSESTGLLTPSGNQIISEEISIGYAGPVAIFGTFSVALLSLPYQYWKSKREHT